MQRTLFSSLVQEDPMPQSLRPGVPQLLKPGHLKLCFTEKLPAIRSPAPLQRVAPTPATRESPREASKTQDSKKTKEINLKNKKALNCLPSLYKCMFRNSVTAAFPLEFYCFTLICRKQRNGILSLLWGLIITISYCLQSLDSCFFFIIPCMIRCFPVKAGWIFLFCCSCCLP